MTLEFRYGINATTEEYSASASVESADFETDPIGSLPDAGVEGYSFLGWSPSILDLSKITKSLTVKVADEEAVTFTSSVTSYKDLFERDNGLPEVPWTNSSSNIRVYLYSKVEDSDIVYYAGITIGNGADIIDDVPLIAEKYTFTSTSLGTIVITPTYYQDDSDSSDSSDASDAIVNVPLIEAESPVFYAAYKKQGGEESETKCTIFLNYVDADGSVRTYDTILCDSGDLWSSVRTQVESMGIPRLSYGFWGFKEWSGYPEAETVTSNYTLWADVVPIDFLLPCDWTVDAPLQCTWGEPLPSITTFPSAVEGKTLNSFYLVSDMGIPIVKSHTAQGESLIFAKYSALGGETVLLESNNLSNIPRASGGIVAMYREPILWNTVEEARGTIGIVPTPFATDAYATTAFAASSEDDSDSDTEVSFSKGFPDAFTRPIIDRSSESTYGSVNQNARVITRQMLNTLGNIGSQEQFFSQCGGYYTFDPAICAAIGGYPQSAILRYYDEENNNIRTVYSLVDNNYWNFLTDGVDGIHWKYVDDNPSLSLHVDYSQYEDISENLFVETGLADMYEVPYDAWLNLFSFSFCDMLSTSHLPSEDVVAISGVEDQTLQYDTVNGGLLTALTGDTYLDVYNANSNTTNSILMRGDGCLQYRASIWNPDLNYGMRYAYKQPRYVIGEGTFFLNKGDQIRVRGVYTDKIIEDKADTKYWDTRSVHTMRLTDKEVRRKYLCKYAMLYRAEWRT